MALMSRRQFFDAVHAAGSLSDINSACTTCIECLREHHGIRIDIPENVTKSIAKTVKCFLYRLRDRWNNCGRFVDYFKTQNSEWLYKDLTFDVEAKTFFAQHSNTTVDPPALDMSEVPSTSQGSEGTSAPERSGMAQQRGRPTTKWQDLAERSRKRKVQDMLTQSGPSELLYAASQGAFKKNNDLKYVLKFAMMTPSRPTKIRKLITKTDNRPERFTQDEALSL